MTKVVISGSVNHFGPRTTETDSPFYVPDDSRKAAYFPLVTTAGSASLYTAQSTSDESLLVIPQYSFILRFALYVDAAFTSTSSATGIDVGLVADSDLSTEVDFNGLLTVGGNGAKASLTDNTWVVGDGALLSGSTQVSADSQLYALWAGGTDTLTGTAVGYIEWLEPPTSYLGDHA
jgi:hypothetical protein